MVKTIAMDLGGVYFEDGTEKAVEKIYSMVDVPKEKVDEIFKVQPKKEGWLYRTGKLTRDEFWNAAAKKLGINKEQVPEFQELWHSSYTPMEGMEELVAGLRKNYKVIVFSRNIQERFNYLNKKYGLSERFDDFVLSFEAGYGKEDTKMYEILLERAGCAESPENCILVDDKQRFLDIAASLRIRTILFENAKQLKSELRKHNVRI